MIRRAALSLQPSWKSDQDARAHSFGPEKEEEGSNFKCAVNYTRADGRARAAGRKRSPRATTFILHSAKNKDRGEILPPPPSPLTHSLVPQRRDWPRSPRPSTPAWSSGRRNERASVSVGTWNIAPFLPSTRPALPLPRASVSRAEQLHLAKLHETMNRREVYYRVRWAAKRRGSSFKLVPQRL